MTGKIYLNYPRKIITFFFIKILVFYIYIKLNCDKLSKLFTIQSIQILNGRVNIRENGVMTQKRKRSWEMTTLKGSYKYEEMEFETLEKSPSLSLSFIDTNKNKERNSPTQIQFQLQIHLPNIWIHGHGHWVPVCLQKVVWSTIQKLPSIYLTFYLQAKPYISHLEHPSHCFNCFAHKLPKWKRLPLGKWKRPVLMFCGSLQLPERLKQGFQGPQQRQPIQDWTSQLTCNIILGSCHCCMQKKWTHEWTMILMPMH